MYKNMYMTLLKAALLAMETLKEAVQEADRLYIESDDTPLTIAPPSDNNPT